MSNPLYSENSEEGNIYKELIDNIYPQIILEIWAFEKPYAHLGYPSDGGVTAYFGKNITKKDLILIKKFLDY